MHDLTMPDLQRHIDRRSKGKNRSGESISPVTIKKEISTLSGVWNWGCRMGLVQGTFPSHGLRYPKAEESMPFMTWEEIERSLAAGGNSDDLWECLYLRLSEITELLASVKVHATQPFVHPMFCFAAHTGARRSEMLRAQLTDLDFQGQTVLIREKKKKRRKRTTRRVPLSPFLRVVLEDWLKPASGGYASFLHGWRCRPQQEAKPHYRPQRRAGP